jgi:hypothetical protein
MSTRAMRITAALGAVLCAVLGHVCAARAQDTVSREYQIKAAFLIKFAQFVEWPGLSAPATPSETDICIVGDDPFGKAIDTLISLSDSRDQYLTVQRVKEKEYENCRFLFISSSLGPRIPLILGEIGSRAIVTVSDVPDFCTKGGMIELFVDGRSVRFKINQAEAVHRGIKLSSKLLSLAREVVR